MKRIIDGVTYNTETALRIHINEPMTRALYQGRNGLLFLYEDGKLRPVGQEDAAAFLRRCGVPKKVALLNGGEHVSTLRIPAVLRELAERKAAKSGQSVTAYIARLMADDLMGEDNDG
jgi:hypothetical protein